MGRSGREVRELKERNKELEVSLERTEARYEQLDRRYDQLEKTALQKRFQQLLKLQVLAPRTLMSEEVLPRFVKLVVSEDFDEARTQRHVQDVMGNMVQVIEEKLRGIFGPNCLRSTAVN